MCVKLVKMDDDDDDDDNCAAAAAAVDDADIEYYCELSLVFFPFTSMHITKLNAPINIHGH